MDKVWIAVSVAPPGTGDASHFHGAFSTKDKAMEAAGATEMIEQYGGSIQQEDDTDMIVVLDDIGDPCALVFPATIDVPRLEELS